MLRLHLIPATAGVFLCLIFASCRQNVNLRDRIIANDTSKYCLPDACFNPHVLAVENGYEVTTFLGAKPQHAHVPTKSLAKYLQSLPMQVWPRGRQLPSAQQTTLQTSMPLSRTSLLLKRFAAPSGFRS
jgi:hypothetical protein